MYTVGFPAPGTAVTWSLTASGVRRREHDYRPTFHVAAPGATLEAAGALLDGHPKVAAVRRVERRTGWRRDREPVLAVDAVDHAGVDELATTLAGRGRPGRYRLFDVDLSRGFRYCLETGTDPTPAREPTTLRLATPDGARADDGPLDAVAVGDETHTGDPATVAAAVERAVADRDPDVLRVDAAALVPALFDASDRATYRLGRDPGYETLAGASTVESYGRVGHSPARHAVPGRALVDESNSFFLAESGFPGLLDLVSRSRRPLQETAWASIGRVLTAVQVTHARRRDVLVPWRSWRRERFKSARVLNDADRGGFTFAPEVGVHEGVHELDFASLYPAIIRTRNVSPETVRCDCHPDREDVPGLGYAVCPDDGYLPDVLGPIIDDRAAMKETIAASDDAADVAALEAKASALKWILVACFGYQGFANAKFGRIECHEAINAFAREILLDAKDALEAAGWRVVHGIVDSLWVQADPDRAQRPLDGVAAAVTDDVGIPLEHEAEYDWMAFCPRRDGAGGALTRHFGHRAGAPVADDEGYTYRGIETRQRSTPPHVATVQRALVRTYGQTRAPEAVLDRLRRELARLAGGDVDPERLAVTNRVSRPREAYERATRNAAALDRAADRDRVPAPGQDVQYVVVDDDRDSRDRVALLSEEPVRYDASFYRERLVRAATSVLSPLGWSRGDVDAALADRTDATLAAFGDE